MPKGSFQKAAPERPPKEWWDRMEKKVREGNPDYSDEQVRKTVGSIWYHEMSTGKKREETKKSEGAKKTSQLNDFIEDIKDLPEDKEQDEPVDVNKYIDKLKEDEEDSIDEPKKLDLTTVHLPDWSASADQDLRKNLEDLNFAIDFLWKPVNVKVMGEDELEQVILVFEKAEKFLPFITEEFLENKEDLPKITEVYKTVVAWLPELKKAIGITASVKKASVLDGVFASLSEHMVGCESAQIRAEAEKLYAQIEKDNNEKLEDLAARIKMDPMEFGGMIAKEALGQESDNKHSLIIPAMKTAQEEQKEVPPSPAPAPSTPKQEPEDQKAVHVTDLFSKKFENWIVMEAELRSQFGEWASLEEANEKIDKAVEEISAFLQDAVSAEVERLVNKRRDELLEQMAAEIPVQQVQQPIPVQPVPATPVQPVEPQKIQPVQKTQVPPVQGSKRKASEDESTIKEAIANTLWAVAWSDREEEEGRTYPGQDIMDVVPKTPSDAYKAAEALWNRIKQANPDRDVTTPEGGDPEEFGFYLALEGLGAGAAWTDDHEPHGYKVPYFEYHYMGDDDHFFEASTKKCASMSKELRSAFDRSE